MKEALVECVPNFSEGREPAIILAILKAMRLPGVRLLDYSLDHDHNRSVVTIAGPQTAVGEAVIRAAGVAAERIDLTRHRGEHPRIGATDVIPFVPLDGVNLLQCALLARETAGELWNRYGVPSYLYEAAASRPDRLLLEEVRRGQFEGLRDAIPKDPSRRPDVGGPGLHPTAGASAVGARPLLIAYNIFLETEDVGIARAIARSVRASSGGLDGVKALGLLVNGRAQVSLNITNFRLTPVSMVHGAVVEHARKLKTRTSHGELIGLLPEAAWEPESVWAAELAGFAPDDRLLERRLAQPLAWPETLAVRLKN